MALVRARHGTLCPRRKGADRAGWMLHAGSACWPAGCTAHAVCAVWQRDPVRLYCTVLLYSTYVQYTYTTLHTLRTTLHYTGRHQAHGRVPSLSSAPRTHLRNGTNVDLICRRHRVLLLVLLPLAGGAGDKQRRDVLDHSLPSCLATLAPSAGPMALV